MKKNDAQVSARMYNVDKSSWRARFYNSGPSDAFNVRVLLNDQNKLISGGAVDDTFPIKKMEKGQSVEIFANDILGSPSKEDVTML